MITTVTINTTLDLTLFVPTFQMNKTTRATRTVQSMGGKPTDASWILGEMGIPSLALGCAAGAIGERVTQMLQARGVTVDFVPVGGETRINTVIVVEDGSGQATITTSTLEVSAEQLDALRAKYVQALDDATCVVLGGTLPRTVPPVIYSELIGLARKRGLPVVFDADEPNLSAGLAAQPTFIKPNQDELSALTGKSIVTLEDAYHAGREIVERYGTLPIITLGGQGGLAVLTERAYFIPPLNLQVVSASGAGDGVLAGLAAMLHHGWSVEDGLRLGFAAAGAVCLQPGTADCRRADVERLREQVELIPYP